MSTPNRNEAVAMTTKARAMDKFAAWAEDACSELNDIVSLMPTGGPERGGINEAWWCGAINYQRRSLEWVAEEARSLADLWGKIADEGWRERGHVQMRLAEELAEERGWVWVNGRWALRPEKRKGAPSVAVTTEGADVWAVVDWYVGRGDDTATNLLLEKEKDREALNVCLADVAEVGDNEVPLEFPLDDEVRVEPMTESIGGPGTVPLDIEELYKAHEYAMEYGYAFVVGGVMMEPGLVRLYAHVPSRGIVSECDVSVLRGGLGGETHD